MKRNYCHSPSNFATSFFERKSNGRGLRSGNGRAGPKQRKRPFERNRRQVSRQQKTKLVMKRGNQCRKEEERRTCFEVYLSWAGETVKKRKGEADKYSALEQTGH